MDDLSHLLHRSDAFADRLRDLIVSLEFSDLMPREAACANAVDLSIEHAHAVRTLVSVGTGNSGCVVLPAQYEALVRSAWAIYAATDTQIEKLNEPLGSKSEQSAKSLPGAKDILSALKKRTATDRGLKGLVDPLIQFHKVSWRALNSFMQGGLHPIQRVEGRFPVKLASQVLLNSNGMMHLAVRMMARLGVHPEIVEAVECLSE